MFLRLLLLVSCSLISACEMAYIVRNDLLEYVDSAITRGHYADAEKLLLRVKNTHPNYGELQIRLLKVQRYIEAYETGIINQAHLLEKEERWQVAQGMYTGALRSIPESKRLLQEKHAFTLRYEYALAQLDAELLRNEGGVLIDNQLVYEQMFKLKPNDRKTHTLEQANNRRIAVVSRKLLSHAEIALARHDYLHAQDCFTSAFDLTPTADIERRLRYVQREVAVRQQNEVRFTEGQVLAQAKPLMPATTIQAESDAVVSNAGNISRVRTQETKKHAKSTRDYLLQAYSEAVREARLYQANLYMQKLLHRQPDNREIKTLKRDLDRLIASKLEVEYDTAIRLYSQGDIEQALLVWRNILPLDPHNPALKSDIARAERVLANLDRIGSKQRAN